MLQKGCSSHHFGIPMNTLESWFSYTIVLNYVLITLRAKSIVDINMCLYVSSIYFATCQADLSCTYYLFVYHYICTAIPSSSSSLYIHHPLAIKIGSCCRKACSETKAEDEAVEQFCSFAQIYRKGHVVQFVQETIAMFDMS